MKPDNLITGKSTGFGLLKLMEQGRVHKQARLSAGYPPMTDAEFFDDGPATDAEMQHAIQFAPGSVTPAAEKITGKPIPLAVRPLLPADGLAEVRFHPTRRWKFDFAWGQHRVALEVEGGAFVRGRHTRGKGFVNDMEKYNEAAARGWIVIRCTPQQLESGQAGAWVARTIATRKEKP